VFVIFPSKNRTPDDRMSAWQWLGIQVIRLNVDPTTTFPPRRGKLQRGQGVLAKRQNNLGTEFDPTRFIYYCIVS